MKATIRKTSDDGHKLPAQGLPPGGETVHLQRNQGASLSGVAGWTVHALRGRVWITQDGDIRDVVLEAGQSFEFDRNAVALLWPMGGGGAAVGIRVRHDGRRPQASALPVRAAFA